MVFVGLAACKSGSDNTTAAPKPTAPPAPGPEERKEPTVPIAAKESPKDTYGRLCAPCHAKDLRGNAAEHAPSLVSPTFLESASDDFLRSSIANGRPGTAMPAYGKASGGPLDDAAVAALAGYIRSEAPNVKPVALGKGGKGDAKKGAAMYAEYCKVCHGDESKRGESVQLGNPEFQRAASDAYIRYAIDKGRPGTKMLPFGQVMQGTQLDDMVAYVRTLNQGPATVQLLPEPTGKEPIVVNPKGAAPVLTPRDGRFVGVDAIAKALSSGQQLVIIDARPAPDWRRVRIKGAVSIPYHDLRRLDEVPKDAVAVAYCACPHHLSGIVVDELLKRGHKKAYVLDEGINAWHQRGYPVEAAAGVKPGL
jgi:cytochrome c oxidase cbb3-type subunit III